MGDGGAVTWIMGPYHRLALEKAFPPPEAREGQGRQRAPGRRRRGKLPTPRVEVALSVLRSRPTGLVAYQERAS
jgi:hypothetical protein